MINQRLFDHYRIDTGKDLTLTQRCPRPFDTVLIDKRGSCYACECQSWLPQSIGNLQLKSLQEIIGGGIHQHLQSSITDGTYRYCNEHQCAYLKTLGPLHDSPERIKHLRLAIDDSCNLRCPSCRNGLIFHKEGSAYDLGIRLADKINDWLNNHDTPIKVHIGSDGDPFASHVYRHFMRTTPTGHDTSYSILTNGLMLRDFHGNIQHIISRMDTLGISIDGATKTTYEKLRLGGQWDKILDALACAKSLKDQHGFRFYLYTVVQQDNWHEMERMVELGHKHGVDKVFFNKIEDWNTNIDMSAQDFTGNAEFLKILERVKKDPIARADNVTSI